MRRVEEERENEEKFKSLVIKKKKFSKCFEKMNDINFSYYFLKSLQILLRRPSLGGQAW